MEKSPSGQSGKVEWKPGTTGERQEVGTELTKQWAEEAKWTELAGRARIAEEQATDEEKRAELRGIREQIDAQMAAAKAKREELASRLESMMNTTKH